MLPDPPLAAGRVTHSHPAKQRAVPRLPELMPRDSVVTVRWISKETRRMLPRQRWLRLMGAALFVIFIPACASPPGNSSIAPHFVSAQESGSARTARQYPECIAARDDVDQQPPLVDVSHTHDRARSDPALRLPGHCRDIVEHPQLKIPTREQWVPDFSGERD